MDESGRGFVRMRAVTIRKKGDDEERLSVDEDVVSVSPSFTMGFVDLYMLVKRVLKSSECQWARTGGTDDHPLDPSFFHPISQL